MAKAYKCDCCEKLFELTKEEEDNRTIRIQRWEDYKDGKDIYKTLDLCNECYNKIKFME